MWITHSSCLRCHTASRAGTRGAARRPRVLVLCHRRGPERSSGPLASDLTQAANEANTLMTRAPHLLAGTVIHLLILHSAASYEVAGADGWAVAKTHGQRYPKPKWSHHASSISTKSSTPDVQKSTHLKSELWFFHSDRTIFCPTSYQ
jgi:hypothetical protein